MSRPQIGDVFAGKYRIERVLGEGGMGYVLEATHLHLQEKVALKLLQPMHAQQPEVVHRFLREARAAVKIRSEHVAKVYDVGTVPEDGTPFIVMELLEGKDLAELIKLRGALPPSLAVDFLLQACEAVAQAHALGIVHRDLKPSNLFLSRSSAGVAEGSVKVLDFGISKSTQAGQTDMSMTRTSTLLGSPRYMSPEQLVSAKDVDARADIWSIGAILYELIAGRPPFNARTLPELGSIVLSGKVPNLAAKAKECPLGLVDVVNRCLRKMPGERFATLADFAQAVAPFGTDQARLSAQRITATLAGAAPPPPPSTLENEEDNDPKPKAKEGWASHVPNAPSSARMMAQPQAQLGQPRPPPQSSRVPIPPAAQPLRVAPPPPPPRAPSRSKPEEQLTGDSFLSNSALSNSALSNSASGTNNEWPMPPLVPQAPPPKPARPPTPSPIPIAPPSQGTAIMAPIPQPAPTPRTNHIAPPPSPSQQQQSIPPHTPPFLAVAPPPPPPLPPAPAPIPTPEPWQVASTSQPSLSQPPGALLNDSMTSQPSPFAPPHTAAGWQTDSIPPKRSTTLVALAVAIPLVVLCIGGGVAALVMRHKAASPTPVLSSALPVPTPTPTPSAVVSAEPAPTTTASAEPPPDEIVEIDAGAQAEPVASAQPAQAQPAQPAQPQPGGGTAALPVPIAKPKPKASASAAPSSTVPNRHTF